MKIIKSIPNTITSLNLLSGVLGVIFTMNGRFDVAFPLMLAAAVFDFCDGMAARALNAYSDIGKELDSLSDMVSFGVLPSLMLYQTMMIHTSGSILCFIPLILAVLSGLRLAKFNIDERQTVNFIGLATPSAAMLCGSLAYYIDAVPDSFLSHWAEGYVFIPMLSVCLALLLVSEIPMFSMKIKKDVNQVTRWKRTAFLCIAFICLIVVLISGKNWSLFILLTFMSYIVMNLLFSLFKATR